MKVIFLDIDGVLYPCFSRRTSCFHAEAVRSRLQKEGISTEGITDWDLCSVVCGFQIAAVERLRRLCEQSGAKIVLETSWKCMRNLDEMKRLFSLWRLDSYIVEMTDNEEMFFKEGAIQRYLDARIRQWKTTSFWMISPCGRHFPDMMWLRRTSLMKKVIDRRFIY